MFRETAGILRGMSPFIAALASPDSGRIGLGLRRWYDVDPEPPRHGLPRLIELSPHSFGSDGVHLDDAAREKLRAAGVDVERIEQELRGLRRGDRKQLDVVYGAEPDVPRDEVEEQLRWYGIVPTEEEEERLARGETVTFFVGGDTPAA